MKKEETRGPNKKVASPVSKENGEWIREIFEVGRRFDVDHRTARRMGKDKSIKTKVVGVDTFYFCPKKD